jgi:hypothetical protein
VKPTLGDPMANRVASEPQPEQLVARQNTMLLSDEPPNW